MRQAVGGDDEFAYVVGQAVEPSAIDAHDPRCIPARGIVGFGALRGDLGKGDLVGYQPECRADSVQRRTAQAFEQDLAAERVPVANCGEIVHRQDSEIDEIGNGKCKRQRVIAAEEAIRVGTVAECDQILVGGSEQGVGARRQWTHPVGQAGCRCIPAPAFRLPAVEARYQALGDDGGVGSGLASLFEFVDPAVDRIHAGEQRFYPFSPKRRAAFVLVAVECLPLEEAASLLAAKPAAIKQRVLEARRELAVALERVSGEERR